MKVYLDSSSFAKRFVDEAGSDRAESACAEASQLGLSVICAVEIVSGLNRRKREHTLTARQYREAKQSLLRDIQDADIIQLTPSIIASATGILEASPVRAIDALHVACALEWSADLFASSDERQLRAAKRARLKTRRI